MAEPKNHWKDKYLRSLNDLERKEKLWQESEDLLRRALGKLAHTGYGHDPSLDARLDDVRTAVKKKHEAKSLDQLARMASEASVDAQDRTQQEAASIAQALIPLIAPLEADKALKKKIRKLNKGLQAVEKGEPLRPLLQEVSELLSASNASNQDADAPTQSALASRTGLLDRILGAADKDKTSPNPATGAVSARVLESLLASLQAQANQTTDRPWSATLQELQHQAAQCDDEQQAQSLMHEAAQVLSDALDKVPTTDNHDLQPIQAANQSAGHALFSAGEALLELMTRIEIPHHLQQRLIEVKSAILNADDIEQIQAVIQAIADLMSEIRRDVQNEKRDLESFLEGVTTRIQELSENVQDLGGNRQASTKTHNALQDSLTRHMRGMRSRVADTEDVESLKQTIQEGLDAIESQLSNHIQREAELTRDAEQRIAHLSKRLVDMDDEAKLMQKEMHTQRDLAMRDPLTGVCSRLAMEEHMAREFSRWQRYQEPLSLCIIDIDFFKKINDTFGHLAGDKALKALAKRLHQNVRGVDIVSRYGGEEFVIIMPNTGLEPAYQVAEKLRGVVAAASFRYGDKPVSVTVSSGVAMFHEGDAPSDVFKRADDALYGAKNAGRNRTHREQHHGSQGDSLKSTA